jgi:hypothetical protein
MSFFEVLNVKPISELEVLIDLLLKSCDMVHEVVSRGIVGSSRIVVLSPYWWNLVDPTLPTQVLEQILLFYNFFLESDPINLFGLVDSELILVIEQTMESRVEEFLRELSVMDFLLFIDQTQNTELPGNQEHEGGGMVASPSWVSKQAK